MNTLVPKITEQIAERLVEELLRRAPGYVPEWNSVGPSKGEALLRVFARYMETLQAGLDCVPERSRLAFLDMLGIGLLPAQGSRAPLVFSLVENSPLDVSFPARSEVAAQLLPRASASGLAGPAPNNTSQSLIFSTEQAIAVSRAQIKAFYSTIPGTDEWTNHSAKLSKGFTLFADAGPSTHAIYLGHDELFALAGDISVILSVTLQENTTRPPLKSGVLAMPASRPPLPTNWEYLTDQGWLPFTVASEDDTTDGLRKDGQIVMRRECGPKAKQDTIEGRTSYWLRGMLTKPLLSDGTGGQRTVPVVNDLRVRVAVHKEGIVPDAAFADSVALDVSKEFYPFGELPAKYPTFYVASKEVFQRKGAQIRLDLKLSQVGKPVSMKLEWDFWNGNGWESMGVQPDPFLFTNSGSLSFLCPSGWAETSVNGSKNYWLRVRVKSGDFGFPIRLSLPPTRTIKEISADGITVTLDTNEGYTGGEAVMLTKNANTHRTSVVERIGGDKIVLLDQLSATNRDFINGTIGAPPVTPSSPSLLLPANLQPPVVSSLALAYTYTSDPTVLDHCLTENEFVFSDETEACRWPDRTFRPFRPLLDQRPTVHMGFDQDLPTGLLSLYVDVPQAVVGGNAETERSPFLWEYRSSHGWTELGVLDATLGFHRSGMIQFVGPPDAIRTPGLGENLIRLRARLKPGERMEPLAVGGLWFNAVWAQQSRSIDQEPLGITDGNPDQTFLAQRRPILKDVILEIQEWTGKGEGWRFDLKGVHSDELRFERHPITQDVTAVWVRWQERSHFYEATSSDRVYVIDRARGIIRLGNGLHGMTPPAGRPVRFSYRTSDVAESRAVSTVPAGAISELRTAVPFVALVTNPVAAGGGAESETLDRVKVRGAQRIRHVGRAISDEDFEWLAREATPEVARARCLSLTGPAGHAQRGWVTMRIAPFSQEAEPQPSAETMRRVRSYLVERAPASVASRIRVTGVRYTRVSVRAEVVPQQADQAAQVEARVRENLNRFLHPLTGGIDGQGWEFGQAAHLSQIAYVIEATAGVDYAAEVMLMNEGHLYEELISVQADGLVAAGNHELTLTVGMR